MNTLEASVVIISRNIPENLFRWCFILCIAAFPPCRYIMVVMGFFGLINVYTLRVNLNVAIVDMVNSTYLHEMKMMEKEAAANGSMAVVNVTKPSGTYCEVADNGNSSSGPMKVCINQ